MPQCPSCGAVNIAGESECQSCGTSLLASEAGAPKKGMEKRILEGVVSDLKPREAWSVPPSQRVKDAVDLMRSKKGGCVLVLEKGELQGVFSERELLLLDPSISDQTPISEVMWEETPCLLPSDWVADAFHQMAVSGHRHLPVNLGDGKYGVVSSRDLLGYLCR